MRRRARVQEALELVQHALRHREADVTACVRRYYVLARSPSCSRLDEKKPELSFDALPGKVV